MQGESEFTVGGVFKNWSILDRLNLIEVPTLVIAGEFDTMTTECHNQLVDGIKYSWPLVVIPRTSHCKLLEEPFLCTDVMKKFLNTNESKYQNLFI
jgi:L-proline amide hydrolase